MKPAGTEIRIAFTLHLLREGHHEERRFELSIEARPGDAQSRALIDVALEHLRERARQELAL